MSYEYDGGSYLPKLRKFVGVGVAIVLFLLLIFVGISFEGLHTGGKALYIIFWVLLGLEHVILPLVNNEANLGYYYRVLSNYFY